MVGVRGGAWQRGRSRFDLVAFRWVASVASDVEPLARAVLLGVRRVRFGV